MSIRAGNDNAVRTTAMEEMLDRLFVAELRHCVGVSWRRFSPQAPPEAHIAPLRTGFGLPRSRESRNEAGQGTNKRRPVSAANFKVLQKGRSRPRSFNGMPLTGREPDSAAVGRSARMWGWLARLLFHSFKLQDATRNRRPWKVRVGLPHRRDLKPITIELIEPQLVRSIPSGIP